MFRIIIIFSLLFTVDLTFAQWQKVAYSFPGEVTSFEIIDNIFYAGADSCIYISNDEGKSWAPASPISDTTEIISAITKFNDSLFVGTFLHGVFVSPDDGVSWQQINGGLNGLGSLSISSFVCQNDRLIAGTEGSGTYIFNQNTRTWNSFGNLPLKISGTVYTMINKNDTVFAGAGVNGFFYKLLPGSDLWEEVNFTGGSLVPATSFTWINNKIYIATTSGIYFSLDNEKHWIDKRLQTSNYALICNVQNNLYAMFVKQGASFFYYSTDMGENWINNEPPDFVFTYSMKASGNKIFTARGDGLWYREAGITAVEDNNILPSEVSLQQNYPNPFNPVTKIKYSLPEDTRVNLDLYSLTGEKVMGIIDSFQKAGSHERMVSVNNLAAGIYICRLITDGFPAKTIKIVLLK